jgi:soluble lytic murein transglycosylase-like protein
VDSHLIKAVMPAESAFDPTVVSRAGAQGLMQLMPALAEELGVTDPFDPRQNIMAGARYLRWLLDVNKGNIPLTLASYTPDRPSSRNTNRSRPSARRGTTSRRSPACWKKPQMIEAFTRSPAHRFTG